VTGATAIAAGIGLLAAR